MIQYLGEVFIFPDAKLAGYTIPGWYFWDETLTHCYGPYDTQEDAKKAFKEYVAQLQ